MAYDSAVVNTAYSTAVGMGASEKVLLALFEAAIVESGFRNLPHGDLDSLGYLQQRPSQGWPSPMDVPTATRSFVSKAMSIEGRYSTAGQLAQAVQVSKFPFKYDAVRSEAAMLLANTKGSVSVSLPGAVPTGNPLESFKFITRAGSWKRIGLFGLGYIAVIIAISRVTGIGPKEVAKAAALVAK